MSIKPSDIWPANNGLPSLEEIHRYVDGKMTRDEQYRFERQIEASELLAHAVEGLMLERTKTHENIEEINAFIDQKTGKEAKVVSIFSYSNLAIAASILVVISAGILFLIHNRDEKSTGQIAVVQLPAEPLQNSDAAPPSAPPPAASENEIATEGAKTDDALAYIVDEEKAGPSAPKASAKRRSRKNREAASQPVVVDDLASAPLASAGQAAEAEETPGAPMDTVSYELLAMNMMDTELKTEELEKDKTDRAFEPSDAKELRLSESKPAPASSAKSSSAGAASPKRKKSESAKDNSIEEKKAQSIYKWDESIIVFIKSGKPNLALMELNIIIDANDQRKEPAIWLKAACLLTMHRKKDAKEMLRILSETSGIYREKAVNLLKALR